MKKFFFVLLCVTLVSCGQTTETTETETQTTQIVETQAQTSTQSLMAEEQKILDDFMKEYETTLRTNGNFDEETIQKALEVVRTEKTQELLSR